MTPIEVEEIARRLFGKRWKGVLGPALGLDYTAMYRQLKQGRISGPVESTLRAWDFIYKTQKLLPPLEPGGNFRKQEAPKKLTTYAKAMLDDE